MSVLKFMPKALVVVAALFVALPAMADDRTLITLDGSTPKAALAKSWTKVKDGEYRFELDKTKKVKGAEVTAAMVKDSLEKRMKKYSVAVKADGDAAVVITYSGAENEFLEKLSKSRIRAAAGVNLAYDQSVSDGGIRAKDKDAEPEAGEVKGMVSKSKKKWLQVSVTSSKFDGIKENKKVKLKNKFGKIKRGSVVFFKPTEKKGKFWEVEDGSFSAAD